MKKKRGPKPRHGTDNPCVRKSLSIPEDIWEWCEHRAGFLNWSASAYIVRLIQVAKLKGDVVKAKREKLK
jgi:hypothetical protein